MNYKNGSVDARNLGQGIEFASRQVFDERKVKHQAGHFSGVSKGTLHNQTATRVARGQVHGHGAAQGVTVDNNVLRQESSLVCEVTIGSLCITVDADFVGGAFT